MPKNRMSVFRREKNPHCKCKHKLFNPLEKKNNTKPQKVEAKELIWEKTTIYMLEKL